MNIKILIIRFTTPKDVLLSTSFIRQVRISFPDAQIDFVTAKPSDGFITYNPHIDHLYTLDAPFSLGQLWKLRKQLKQTSYTHIFDLQNNFYSKLFSLFRTNRIPLEKGKTGDSGKNRLTIPVPLRSWLQEDKQAQREEQTEIYWKDKAAAPVFSFMRKNRLHNGFWLFADSGKQIPKKHEQLIYELAGKRGQTVVVLGNEERMASSKHTSGRILFTGKRFDLLESAILMSQAKMVLTTEELYQTMANALRIKRYKLPQERDINNPQIVDDLSKAP